MCIYICIHVYIYTHITLAQNILKHEPLQLHCLLTNLPVPLQFLLPEYVRCQNIHMTPTLHKCVGCRTYNIYMTPTLHKCVGCRIYT